MVFADITNIHQKQKRDLKLSYELKDKGRLGGKGQMKKGNTKKFTTYAAVALAFAGTALTTQKAHAVLTWDQAHVASFIHDELGDAAAESFTRGNNVSTLGGRRGAALEAKVVTDLLAGNASTVFYIHSECQASPVCQVSLPESARRNIRTEDPASAPAIWPVIRTYRLVNAPVARAAAVLADYPHYGRIFRGSSMRSAQVINGSMRDNPWRYDVQFRAQVTIPGTNIDAVEVPYRLRNVWTTANDALIDSWEFLSSTNHVALAQGRAKFVQVRDGEVEKTLVIYQNYMNPIDPQSPDGQHDENGVCNVLNGFVNVTCERVMPSLDTVGSRAEAVRTTVNIVNTIRSISERASGVDATALTTVCTHLGSTLPGCVASAPVSTDGGTPAATAAVAPAAAPAPAPAAPAAPTP